MKNLRHEFIIGTNPVLHILKDFSEFLQLLDKKFVKHARKAKAIRMVAAIVKKTTPPRDRREAYVGQKGKKKGESLSCSA